MGKKLVKTAKQQFEERLRELTLIKEFQLVESDCYYLCENDRREMSILRKIHDKELYEYKYDTSYRELIESEEFLKQMTDRFREAEILIKPLFEWYASADKDNEPFTLDDIWMCDLELRDHTVIFADFYEEVPDVRVITAKEQWKRDSKDAGSTIMSGNDSYRIVRREECIDVYVDKDGKEFFKETLPSIEELRKDAEFVTKYLSYMNAHRSNFMKHALNWLSNGKFTMNEYGLLDIYKVCAGYCNEIYQYMDEELPKPIAKQEFKEELDELRAKMVAHIEQLCEQGMKLNVEVLCMDPFLLWEDACYASTEGIEDCWMAKDDKNRWRFYWKNKDGEHDDRLSYFTIDGLRNVIEALQ